MISRSSSGNSRGSTGAASITSPGPCGYQPVHRAREGGGDSPTVDHHDRITADSRRVIMPIHDWTRVQSGLFHESHQSWSIRIKDALNSGVLTKGYYAL